MRATNDVDYLIDGARKDAVKGAFAAKGFRLFAQTDEVLQFEGPGPVDLLLANRPLSQAMLARQSGVDFLGIPSLDAADLIGLKIQAYINDRRRELQDLADIQKLMEKNPGLDWRRLQQYAELFGEWERIAALRSRR
jgi:hypothetical protein